MAYDTDELYTEISLTDGCDVFESDFNSEKDFTENLMPKLEGIVKNMYNDEIETIELEKTFPLRSVGLQNIRADIYITGKKSDYLIECKNPSQYVNEINIAVGQIMSYDILTRKAGKNPKIILATSDCEFMLFEMIYRFRLPFDIILNNENKVAVWLNEFK